MAFLPRLTHSKTIFQRWQISGGFPGMKAVGREGQKWHTQALRMAQKGTGQLARQCLSQLGPWPLPRPALSHRSKSKEYAKIGGGGNGICEGTSTSAIWPMANYARANQAGTRKKGKATSFSHLPKIAH
jgi:hypothetical protein